MVNFQPSGLTSAVYSPDTLLVTGPFETRQIVIAQNAGQTSPLPRGQLLCLDANGRYQPLAAAETTVLIDAAGEVIRNNLAGSEVSIDVVTAKPPIPGTLQLATTADGSATIVLNLGTDNGRGVGSGAGGLFFVDYHTGRIRAVFTTAPTASHDLKAGYKHRNPAAGVLALPTVVLAEEIEAAKIAAGHVTTLGYVRGVFNSQALVGYSPGYDYHLNAIGIWVKTTAN